MTCFFMIIKLYSKYFVDVVKLWFSTLNTNEKKANSKLFPLSGGGQGGREPGRIRAGGGREAGGDRAGSGSHVRAGGGRRMRDIKFLNDFLVPF